MKDRLIYLQQVGLRELGFDPGPLDGDAGPKTAAAFAAWEASLRPATAGSIAAKVVQLATADLWIRETEGKNRGPGIAKYWTATSYPTGYDNREPYCAAAVCYWIKEAVGTGKVPFTLPRSPRAFDFLRWAGANAGNQVELIPVNQQLEPGDIVVWEFSHVSIVEARSPKASARVQTIDANTSPSSGDNEGGGVFRRTRNRAQIRGIVRIFT